MMTVADDLRAARALIDSPEKWCKGHAHMVRSKWFFFQRHSYCALGAIATDPDGYLTTTRPEYVKMLEALDAALPSGFGFVVSFNDDPATTHADIMALFDRAIQAEEAS